MTKSIVTRTWIAGLAVFAAGIIVALVGVFLMLAYGGTFNQVAGTNNYNFVPSMSGTFWTGVGVIVAGGFIALLGGLVQLAAWVGGLVNSYAVPDKTWFTVLLVGGLLGLFFAPAGFAAMLAYVVAAPDASPSRTAAPPPMPMQQPRPLAPTT